MPLKAFWEPSSIGISPFYYLGWTYTFLLSYFTLNLGSAWHKVKPIYSTICTAFFKDS